MISKNTIIVVTVDDNIMYHFQSVHTSQKGNLHKNNYKIRKIAIVPRIPDATFRVQCTSTYTERQYHLGQENNEKQHQHICQSSLNVLLEEWSHHISQPLVPDCLSVVILYLFCVSIMKCHKLATPLVFTSPVYRTENIYRIKLD